ncbi:GDSL-type esterase/lipase family protein [Bacillus sp. USDA818B3_A]|uniref:GDSL-type esterase/lipase family protein n=1 Tax=Bacillus sp. USDA818B3_A TaxID=2698834 RepID=UPI00136E496B|nr:GDSL-type esterase/lipase family protein [Bacillus sp. USDA818B3_A]
MKMLKYLISFVLVIGLGTAVWIYYPHYQLYQMKKHTVKASQPDNKVSYFTYLKDLKADTLHHLALGDSIIRGVGADQTENMVTQFSTSLSEQTDKKIDFDNQGISGITSGELNGLVQNGQFDESIKQADIITINVGGNDVLKAADGLDFESVFDTYDQLQSTYTKNLASITSRVVELNPNATIVLLELYNPLSPDNQMYSLADQLLPKWNVHIYEVADKLPSSIVIETTKVINGEHLQNLSADGVHPNEAGYTAISEQMIYQLKHQYRKTSA